MQVTIDAAPEAWTFQDGAATAALLNLWIPEEGGRQAERQTWQSLVDVLVAVLWQKRGLLPPGPLKVDLDIEDLTDDELAAWWAKVGAAEQEAPGHARYLFRELWEALNEARYQRVLARQATRDLWRGRPSAGRALSEPA
jgi:hypothetical protein